MMSDQCATTLTGPAGDLVEGFHDWLVSERRLAASTVEYYVHAARLFLGELGGQDPAVLGLGEVSSFMVRECRRLSVGSAKKLATGLRSLLRYLYVEGFTEVLRLWLRGEGLRSVERLAGVDRKTVRRYVTATCSIAKCSYWLRNRSRSCGGRRHLDSSAERDLSPLFTTARASAPGPSGPLPRVGRHPL